MSESRPQSRESESELLSDQEALDFLESTLDKLDFSQDLSLFGGPANVATQIAYWSLETFGQAGSDGSRSLYPGHDSRRDFYGEIAGEELPPRLKSLVMHNYMNEVIYGQGNRIKMYSHNLYLENGPFIPRREEIEAHTSYKEAMAFIRANPDIIAGYTPLEIEVLPGVQIDFESRSDWGLVFNLNRFGITCSPYGQPGKTERATSFVIDNHDHSAALAETAAQLSLLGARYTQRRTRKVITPDQLELLEERLSGSKDIPPVVDNSYRPKHGSHLLQAYLREAQNPDLKLEDEN